MKPVKLPPGESGVRKGNLTEERVEALAEYWGTPASERNERWGEPAEIGKLIGVSAATVRKARTDKRVKALVNAAFDDELLYDCVEAKSVLKRIMNNEKERSDTRQKAAGRILQMGGKLQGNAMSVNITNDFSTYADLPTDELLREGRNIFGNDVDEEG